MKIKGCEVEVVRETAYEVDGIKCDKCGKIITPPPESEPWKALSPEYKYYSVTTRHHDWGNESCESVREYDICPDCVIDFTRDYLFSKDASRSGEIAIETKRARRGELLYE